MDEPEVDIGEILPQYCFRCEGLAVVDYGHVKFLPFVLERARYLLMKAKLEDDDDKEEAWGVQSSLKIYADIIEGMAINGREG